MWRWRPQGWQTERHSFVSNSRTKDQNVHHLSGRILERAENTASASSCPQRPLARTVKPPGRTSPICCSSEPASISPEPAESPSPSVEPTYPSSSLDQRMPCRRPHSRQRQRDSNRSPEGVMSNTVLVPPTALLRSLNRKTHRIRTAPHANNQRHLVSCRHTIRNRQVELVFTSRPRNNAGKRHADG
jgi:hypothetical protein